MSAAGNAEMQVRILQGEAYNALGPIVPFGGSS
jgi:hypothetical protein